MDTPLPQVDLSSLFRSDPAAQEIGMGIIGQGKQAAQQSLEAQMIKNKYEPLLNDARIAQENAHTGYINAQTPGAVAQSSLFADKAKLSKDTYTKQLEDAISQHEGSMTAQKLKNLQTAGQSYGQVGALLGTVPPLARHAMAKQMLGDMYHPEFDKLNPNDLADTLTTMGDWMGKAGNKYQMQEAGLTTKGQTAREVADITGQYRLESAKARAAAQRQPAETESQWLARIRTEARNDNPHARAELADYNAQQIAKAAASAGVQDSRIRDILGMPPGTTVPTGATPKNPLSQLPQGTKDNGNGTYTLPDGRIVRPKQ